MGKYVPFYEQLRYERERRNWSQADLAEKVGCETKTVGRWENGETFPRSYHRQTICELFGKSAEELGLMERRSIYPGIPGTSSSPSTDILHESLPAAPLSLLGNTSITTGIGVGESSPFRSDWGDVPQVEHLYGREKECQEVVQWLEVRRSLLPCDGYRRYGWNRKNIAGCDGGKATGSDRAPLECENGAQLENIARPYQLNQRTCLQPRWETAGQWGRRSDHLPMECLYGTASSYAGWS